MRGDKQVRKTAKILLQLSMEQGEVVSERVAAVLRSLEAHPPRDYAAVLRDYHRLVSHELARGLAVVEHAGPLSPETLRAVEESFSALYGRKITALGRENPALIAGLRIRVDSDVHDTSAAHHLHELARAAC